VAASDGEPQGHGRRRAGAIAAPPFWRTRYFTFDVLPRRPQLDPLEIRRVMLQPVARIVQPDGRIRLYGYAPSLGCHLRVVLLSDGETVHNAFPDEDFVP
jgi:hypothetical protein